MRTPAQARTAILASLIAISFAPDARAAEAGVDITGLVGIGYDSNYTLLGSDKNVPPPHAVPDHAAGMWTLGAGAVGWLRPAPILELTLEPDVRMIHFFDNEIFVEPEVDLSLYIYPTPVVEMGVGGGYRYYRFSVFEDESFHEPHAWFELALTPGVHRLSLIYAFAHRIMPPVPGPPAPEDVNETEHSARILWEVETGRLVTLGFGFDYSHIRGTQGWMQLDELKGLLRAQLEWRVLDVGVAYVPGLLWFEQDAMGLLNRAAVWAGVTYPGWIRYGVEYMYEELMDIHDLRAEVPYDRHLFLFAVRLSWGVSTRGAGPVGLPDQGARHDQEGIHVTEGRAVFRHRAAGATSVSVTGSFNGWQDPGASLEGPDADGMWTLELDLQPGRYEIIYIVDGETVTPRGAPSYSDDGFGGRNAVIVVP